MSFEASNPVAASVTHHNPSFLFDMSAGGFAQISVAEPGRLAFLSGQVAGAPNGEHMPPDLTSQAQIVAAHLKKALTELGASANDIVMVRLYVVNATTDRFQQALTALRDTFSGRQAEHHHDWCAGAVYTGISTRGRDGRPSALNFG